MDINELRGALETFAEVDSEIQVQTMLVFLYIAQAGTCTQKSIENAMAISPAAASRNVAYWTDRRFDRRPGMGFVLKQEDDHDRRFKTLSLTLKGTQFYEQLQGKKKDGKTSRKKVDR